MDIPSNRLYDDEDDKEEDGNIISIYNTGGIKVTKRGQWMQEKWSKKKKCCLEIHITCCKYKEQRNTRFRSYWRKSILWKNYAKDGWIYF